MVPNYMVTKIPRNLPFQTMKIMITKRSNSQQKENLLNCEFCSTSRLQSKIERKGKER